MLHMTKEKMEKFSIPLPPPDEQRRIAIQLRDQMNAIEKVRAAAEEERQTIRALSGALQRQAFGGGI
jgi:restriction endonuclease S subunit